MQETGNDDLIWNGCSIYGHGRKSVMDCVSRFVKFNYGFAQNWPKKLTQASQK